MRRSGEERFIVSTNHFVRPEMFDISLYEPPDSRTRYDTMVSMLKDCTDKLNENLLKSILSDHTGLICSHREDIKLGTLWSMVANLNKLRILRAEGHPCKTKYKIDTRLNKVLKTR